MYNKEWIDDYVYLEWLRQNGACNMYGSGEYLEEEYGYTQKEAKEIVVSWMQNYDKLIEDGIITRGSDV